MTIFYFICGAIIGGIVSSISRELVGVVAGGALGLMFSVIATLRSRLDSLERQLHKINRDTPASATLAEIEAKPQWNEPLFEPEPEELTPDAILGPVDQPVYARDQEEQSDQFSYEPVHSPTQKEPSQYNEPSPVVEAINRFFTGGNLMVKIGVIILFFGVSFLVKFAAERGMIPVELRLAAVTAGAIALLVVGWRLRDVREQYALVLQGGGVGILYLTVFAALRLYSLIPAPFAFGLMVAICALSSALAIIQNSRTLAVLGVSGGFLAPILASTGSGSHVALFSYYALLNAGIFGIAWFKAWRLLNLIGFAFTFVISAAWGAHYYQPHYFATTEPFLILFFIMYTTVAVLFAIRQAPELKGYVDGTLVFGTPLVTAAIQSSLVWDYEYGLAWSALGAGFYYIALATWLFSRKRHELRLLSEAFLAFGVVFATLAIPLALDGRWTAAAWALEGGAMVWAGLRQKRWQVRIFGVILLLGGGVFFLADLPPKGNFACLNAFWLGTALIAAAALQTALYLSRNRQKLETWELSFADALLAWGLIWWFFGGLFEISRWLVDTRLMAALVFVALSASACDFAATRLKWNALIMPSFLILPALCSALILQVLSASHPVAHGGWLAWPLSIGLYYLILSRRETLIDTLRPYIHPVPVWIVAILAAWELHWQAGRIGGIAEVWSLLPLGLVPAVLILLIQLLLDRLFWPFGANRRAYLQIGALPLAVAAWLWCILMNIHCSGDAAPLPFIPFLNPLDITQGVITAVIINWVLQLRREEPGLIREASQLLQIIFYPTMFFWLNAEIVRGVHHFGGVPFSFEPMFSSHLFQAAISIIWSITAFCSMTFATRKGIRTVWIIGAVILGAVVLKLFVIDLSGKGTVERIVSFVGVGFLMLIIGWFSPVPPGTDTKEVQ
ncbi:MAG: DUF2339 domain-containing protein [Geobacteraceae bacterium]|nr:DUF2339 domain-containing protein [Geobacteraceae bacterium]